MSLPCVRFYGEPCDPENCCGGRDSHGHPSRRLQRSEQHDLLERFLTELAKPTRDGAQKRDKGTKPPWYIDPDHEAAVYSHLAKWKKGELVDPDSGAHPLVHAAWRLLAIACQETANVPEQRSRRWSDLCPACKGYPNEAHREDGTCWGVPDRADGFA